MRIFHIDAHGVTETDALPQGLPAQGFVWLSFARREFEAIQAEVQHTLERLCGVQLVDLHVMDLLNRQLPSHHDYTSDYSLMVFRRLAAVTGAGERDPQEPASPLQPARPRGGPPVLRRIDTSPVAFVVFERVLLTVHPSDCGVRDAFAARLAAAANHPGAAAPRMPAGPADLMLRIVSLMVDGYLDLRRELTRQLDHWQAELINPNSRFNNWSALLDAQLALHHLGEICEDQRAAVQDWTDALETTAQDAADARSFELLKVRGRDVLEHIERVIHHVRRLEQSAETAVQIHFSVQSKRTNDIMRTLTVLTAIFLPLNLITGFFGMNFENFPVLHAASALWWTSVSMLVLAVVLVVFFWRKRYLHSER